MRALKQFLSISLLLMCNVIFINAQGIVTRENKKSKQKTTTVQNTKKRGVNNQNKKSVGKRSNPSGYVNGYEAIDLGLSVRWAACNVGGSNPYDFGGHFAFGDVTAAKFTGQYMNYPTGNIIGTGYDIAKQNMGEGWRMPSGEECRELVEKCSSQVYTWNGVQGRLVTGPNGNSIFLPFSGIATGLNDIRDYSGANNTPSCNYRSYYWAGESNDCYGEGIENTSSYLSFSYACSYKYYGCSVRAVTD